MKTLCPRRYQYGFVASHALGHTMYGLNIYIYILFRCICYALNIYIYIYMYNINFIKYIETTSHSFKTNNISTLMNL